MSGVDPRTPDVLAWGRERPAWLGAAAGTGPPGPVRSFLRRRRRLVSGAAVVLVVAAAAGLHWYDNRPPDIPPVQVSADRSADSVPLWSAGPDGRPASPVTLSVSSILTAPDTAAGAATVTPVGLAGPGVTSPGAFPRRPLTGAPTSVELTGAVSCDRVRIPVRAGEFSVAVRVSQAGRSRLVDLPLAAAETAVAQRITTGCSTWLAARDVTLLSVAARVDPARPRVDLTLGVSNRGALPALLWSQNLPGTGVLMTPVLRSIPARSTASIRTSVDLVSCWTWDETSLPVTVLETPLQLLIASGVSSPLPPDQVQFPEPGSGLVLSPAAAGQLRSAFVQACGDVPSMVMLTATDGATFDRTRHLLAVHVLIDAPPGSVRRMRVLPIAASAGSTDLVPRFGPSPWLVPDLSGQVGYPVTFGVPSGAACLGGGPFVVLHIQAWAGAAGGPQRLVNFELSAETFLPPRQIQQACAQ